MIPQQNVFGIPNANAMGGNDSNEGRIAVNPQTRQRIIKKNGQWQPL